MTAKVFIDGKEGTTGLQIYEKLGGRKDIELLTLPEDLRKDPGARKEIMDRSDLVFLSILFLIFSVFFLFLFNLSQ